MPKLAPKPPQPQIVALGRGRRLEVAPGESGEVVEIRAADGQLELRVVLTENGPVLQLDAVKLALRADDVAIDCKRLAVNASDEVAIESEGELRTTSAGDTRIAGKLIYLN